MLDGMVVYEDAVVDVVVGDPVAAVPDVADPVVVAVVVSGIPAVLVMVVRPVFGVVVMSCATVTGSATHISSIDPPLPHNARNVADVAVVPIQSCVDCVTLAPWSTTF